MTCKALPGLAKVGIVYADGKTPIERARDLKRHYRDHEPEVIYTEYVKNVMLLETVLHKVLFPYHCKGEEVVRMLRLHEDTMVDGRTEWFRCNQDVFMTLEVLLQIVKQQIHQWNWIHGSPYSSAVPMETD